MKREITSNGSQNDETISRRTVLKAGLAVGVGLAGLSVAGCTGPSPAVTPSPTPTAGVGNIIDQGSKSMVNVIYYSMTGNTKKMAAAIADVFGIQAIGVKEATGISSDGITFLGSGCYGGKPGEDMQKFIDAHDFRGRKVAVFGTSGGGEGKETDAMADALKQKGAEVLGSYDRRGTTFLLINMGHPDQADLDGAREFARRIASSGS